MFRLLFLLMVAVLAGCDVELPSEGARDGFRVSGFAAPLSDEEFAALAPERQYEVADKLLGSMYRGVALADFFDLSRGMERLVPAEGRGFLSSVRAALESRMTAATRDLYDTLIEGSEAAGIEGRFRFREPRKELPLARIFQYPLSRDQFEHWIAWHLANSILFSPAEEMESTDITDVENVYNNLVKDLREGRTIRQIVARHQRSESNWRRFRSPEDNTREMMEIYLGLFDRDEDVPRASIACQDHSLTDESEGYRLVISLSPNTEPQKVLGSFVTSCDDFYDLIAGHPLLIGRITTVLVEYFFAGRSSADRLRIAQSITASDPVTFQDIFLGILFSREYLLRTGRPRSFEESFLGTAQRLDWDPPADLFRNMVSSSSRINMAGMNWPVMSLKLGRLSGIPMDSLSFANYHKGYRERLLIDQRRWRNGLGVEPAKEPAGDAGPEERDRNRRNRERFALVKDMASADYLDYLFLSVALRRAEPAEREALLEMARNAGFLRIRNGEQEIREGRHDDLARMVFDYLSRLPEQYYFKPVH